MSSISSETNLVTQKKHTNHYRGEAANEKVSHSLQESELNENTDRKNKNLSSIQKRGESYGSTSYLNNSGILRSRPVRVSGTEALVFCIHGNKFGFAKCCDLLEEDISNEKTPLLKSKTCSDENGDLVKKHETLPAIGSDQSDQHCHQARSNTIDKIARRKLILASTLCIIFIIVEIAGGVWSNSLAIATDAAHLLTDFASFMISLFALWFSARPATRRMSFGFHRAEVIGATVSVLMIWVITGILVYVAIQRIINKDHQVDAVIMLITSGFGIAVNIIMGFSLHQHSHGGLSDAGGHTHDHSHSEVESGAAEHERHSTNLNVQAAFIHVIGDILQSVGVFVAALCIYFRPTWSLIDPICTFVFSGLVLITTINILRQTLQILMEGIPNNVDFADVRSTFLNVDGILSIHSLRIWGITNDKNALSVHLAIEPGMSAEQILKEASYRIRSKYNFYEMTLQVENYHEKMDECGQCKDPDK